MAKQVVNDFSKGSIISNILRLSIPMTLAQLINVLYSIVDRIYIGRMGENSSLALTGVGVCLPIITIVIAFANLIGMGGAPLFSIKRGEGNEKEAEAILGNSVTLLVIFGLCLTVVGLIVKRPLLYLLGASENTIEYANSYITIYLLGNVFVMMSLGLNSFINAQGFGKTGMFTVVIGAVLNIILDPIFIYIMGVQGAALATVLSQLAASVWTFKFLTGKNTIIKIKLSAMRCQAKRVKKILVLGLSGFTMSVTNSAVQIACNVSLQNYGSDVYVGVMTIINSIREVLQMPVTGLGNGAQPIIGFNYGAGENGRVKEAIRYLAAMLIIYSGMVYNFADSEIPYRNIHCRCGTYNCRCTVIAYIFFRIFPYGVYVYGTDGVCRNRKSEVCDILFYIEKGNSGNTAYTSSSDMVRSKRSIFGRADFKFDRRFGVLYNNVFCGLQKIII